ncbi:MAG: beta-ketoacyl synthase N-terminal-like domain-containing protein, partial [Myxococcota bacterium]
AGVDPETADDVVDRIGDGYVAWQENAFPGLLGNVAAGRIANRLDLHGTNCVVDAACASTFSAISMAVNELLLGQSDMVLTGGVDTMNDIAMYMCFSKTTALSHSGDCRPFSDQADGTMLGEGLGMVALKRLADAERDHDRIYAVLRGVGSSSDGRSKSVYAPVPEGQARALRRAYEVAGYGPETVELVEAHGTGTTAGDAAEFEGLCQVFGAVEGDRRRWCGLGSVKSQVGHAKAAAGAAGLFKVVMALHNRALPPTIKVARPNPKLDLTEGPFYLSTQARPWFRSSDHPRRASVSSFGFGGSNFHLTLEEYTGSTGRRPGRIRPRIDELVLVSADHPAALAEQLASITVQEGSLAWWAQTSQHGSRTAGPARVALVASDEATLAEHLAAVQAHIARHPDQPIVSPTGWAYNPKAVQEGGVALLFPGQGSQYLGMGSEVAMVWPQALAAWDKAASFDWGLERLPEIVCPAPVFEASEREQLLARLTQTRWAQPAIGMVSQALLRLVEQTGLKVDCVGGHSFGEVTALHAAGVLDAGAMLEVARRRGVLMGEAAQGTSGAMAALSASIETVRDLLTTAPEGVVVANHNSP